MQERGGRAILLLNRRGISGAIHCRSCGRTQRCRSCDIALTLHSDSRLHCHHCGYSLGSPRRAPSAAPSSSPGSARGRNGSRRLQRRLPGLERTGSTPIPRRVQARCARRSTLRGRARRRADRDADGCEGPASPASRPSRRGRGCRARVPRLPRRGADFQLVTQLAGRSGRDAPGRVVVQTFQPDATPFSFALRHDVTGFLAQARAARGAPLSTVLPSGRAHRVRARAAAVLRALGELRPRSSCRTSSCSGRRPSSACVADTAHSSWRRQRPRARSRAGLRACSRPPRRRCVATA